MMELDKLFEMDLQSHKFLNGVCLHCGCGEGDDDYGVCFADRQRASNGIGTIQEQMDRHDLLSWQPGEWNEE